MTDRSFDSDVGRNENKTLPNKIINIGTNYLDFREGQNIGILLIGFFFVCAHPTITIREHLCETV